MPYLASKLTLGTSGVVKVAPIAGLSEYEKCRYEEAVEQPKCEINGGLEYAATTSS